MSEMRVRVSSKDSDTYPATAVKIVLELEFLSHETRTDKFY